MPTAIVSERTSIAHRRALEREGFAVLICPVSRWLPDPIAHHPDMVMALLGETFFCYEGYFAENGAFFSALSALCPHIRVVGLSDAPGARFPADCAYNLLKMGKSVFFNPKGLAPTLANVISHRGLKACHTRQGYAACTVRALGDRYAITSDAGMAAALADEGISVLSIREGNISLPPYAHGFIGGASGCFQNTAYFLGDLAAHPDYDAMRHFASEAGFSLRSLSSEPLCDLGGIHFIE